MKIYRILENGYFGGEEAVADDEFGIPLGTTRTAPPQIPPGQHAYWSGSGWVAVVAPPVNIPQQMEIAPSADPVLIAAIDPEDAITLDEVDTSTSSEEIADTDELTDQAPAKESLIENPTEPEDPAAEPPAGAEELVIQEPAVTEEPTQEELPPSE